MVELILGSFLIMWMITLTLKHDSLILYAIVSPTSLVFGLSLAANYDAGSYLWYMGVAIALFGMYFLYCISLIGVGWFKARVK